MTSTSKDGKTSKSHTDKYDGDGKKTGSSDTTTATGKDGRSNTHINGNEVA